MSRISRPETDFLFTTRPKTEDSVFLLLFSFIGIKQDQAVMGEEKAGMVGERAERGELREK